MTEVPVVTTNCPRHRRWSGWSMTVTPRLDEEIRRTLTLLPSATVAGVVLDQTLQVAPLSVDTAYSPPALTEMGDGALMPETVTTLDSMNVLTGTPVWLLKRRPSGS